MNDPLLNQDQIYALLEATWPAAHRQQLQGWTIRDGQGGGKRVSAATAAPDWADETIPAAEVAMHALGQKPLFMIREEDVLLDQALQSRGYRIIDPVIAYTATTAALSEPPAPALSTFPHWHPLRICHDIWHAGGIGPERLAIMERVSGPKTAILARADDKPAGVGFAALHGTHAMLHALEVPPRFRRLGAARNIMRAAAAWAQSEGATTLSVVVTLNNTAARALYTGLGMTEVGQYHYRQFNDPPR